MIDFTITTYKSLLISLQKEDFTFMQFAQYIEGKSQNSPLIILRHDVDLLPQNSLRFAQIQADLGIKGSYYFRAVPESWDENVIKEIASLGHEVGYHYENMDSVSEKWKVKSEKREVPFESLKVMSEKLGDRHKLKNQISDSQLHGITSSLLQSSEEHIDLAYQDFVLNLEKLRKLVPVFTICMHGSPRSKFDNKAIWDKYDYKALGLIGEPYYDVDFDKVFYLTDTGRRWDGWKSSIRDKVPQQELWNKQGLVFHTTQDIIDSINQVKNEKRKVKNEVDSGTLNFEHGTLNFPNQIMFTMHPQRWTNNSYLWTKELILQNIKNVVKRFL